MDFGGLVAPPATKDEPWPSDRRRAHAFGDGQKSFYRRADAVLLKQALA